MGEEISSRGRCLAAAGEVCGAVCGVQVKAESSQVRLMALAWILEVAGGGVPGAGDDVGSGGRRGDVAALGAGRVTRVNSTNVLNEGLRNGEIGRQMNSKVKLVEIGVYRK
jgi:hypothetical protein